MSNYSQITSFTPKDALITGNPAKIVRGSELDPEFAAIAAAIATKMDSTAAAAPTASIGLSAVNGVLSTYMRSDAAPALSQAIVPTWTQIHTFSAKPVFNAGITVAGAAMLTLDGTVGSPAWSFTSDTNTGVYRRAADQLSLVTNGADRLVLDSTQMSVLATNAYFPDGTVGTPGITFNNDTDTGMFRGGANDLRFGVGGALMLQIQSTFVAPLVPLMATDGSAGAPSLTFFADQNTGLYRSGSDSMSAATNGAVHLTVDDNGATPLVRIAKGTLRVQDGVVGLPGLNWDSDTSTGLYRIGAGQVGFAASGVLTFQTTTAAGGGALVKDPGGTLQTVGYRVLPRSTTATTLAIGDVGKCVAITAAINIPASVFGAGDVVTIYNDSAGALNLTISAGTLRLSGTATTGTRSIAARGFCTIWFNSGGATPEVIASGNVT